MRLVVGRQPTLRGRRASRSLVRVAMCMGVAVALRRSMIVRVRVRRVLLRLLPFTLDEKLILL